MLSRFAPRAAAAPKALRLAPVARRNVTTDAASSHVDKNEVPSVCALDGTKKMTGHGWKRPEC